MHACMYIEVTLLGWGIKDLKFCEEIAKLPRRSTLKSSINAQILSAYLSQGIFEKVFINVRIGVWYL